MDKKKEMFIGFNQNATRLSTASDRGYQVYDLPPRGPTGEVRDFRRIRSDASLGAISRVVLLDDSPLIAIVLQQSGSNRFLQLYDMEGKRALSELHFEHPILNVKISERRLAVVLEKQIHMFDLKTMVPLPQIRTTNPANRDGLAAMSRVTDTGACYFAFPQSSDKEQTRGDVFVMDAIGQQQVSVIPAHSTSVAAVELNAIGSRLATCSMKGTIFRVFAFPQWNVLYTFRRGTHDARIYSLALSPLGELLACTSSTGTLHLFRCTGTSDTLRSLAEGTRAYKQLTTKKTRTVCAISTDCSTLTVATLPDKDLGTVEIYKLTKDDAAPAGEYKLVPE